MNAEEMKSRTKKYGLRIVRLTAALPSDRVGWVLGDQLLRCGTSVGANYRAACRARSKAEFVAKLGIVEEECDETLYWMEMLVEADVLSAARLKSLMGEGEELLAIVVASIRTARRR